MKTKKKSKKIASIHKKERFKNVTRFELLMDAGEGAQKAGDILIRTFAAMGKYVYIDPIIPAEISPPPRTRESRSGVIIRLADFDITNVGNDSDVMLCEHEILLDRRLDDDEYHHPCYALLDTSDQEKNPEGYKQVLERAKRLKINVIPFGFDQETLTQMNELPSSGGRGTSKNMYYLGILGKIFQADLTIIKEQIKKAFKNLTEDQLKKNIFVFEKGYAYAEQNIKLNIKIEGQSKWDQERIFIDGNSSMALGIIDAGFKLFAGYPITPASSIMHTLAKNFHFYGGMVHQAEDEISAVGATLGSYYSGVPAITATSGPGLSLKQEFIGLSMAAEVPLVVIDVQRGGPATGLPTRTEQGDLPAAVFGCHGDNTKIVISVSNVIDCYYAPHLARYLTEKLRVPVIILSDNQISSSFKIVNKFITTKMDKVEDLPSFIFKRFHLRPLPKEIEMVKENQAIPGTPGKIHRLVGINTNKAGIISYSGDDNQRSHAIRNAKLHLVSKALSLPEVIGPKKAKLLVVSWGSTRGALEEAVELAIEKGLDVAGMHFRVVYPLPALLKNALAGYKKVVSVERAYGDRQKPAPLAQLIRSETLVDVQPMITETTGRPLRPRKILKEIERLLD